MISVRYKTEATIHGVWKQAFFQTKEAAERFATAYDGPVDVYGDVGPIEWPIA